MTAFGGMGSGIAVKIEYDDLGWSRVLGGRDSLVQEQGSDAGRCKFSWLTEGRRTGHTAVL